MEKRPKRRKSKDNPYTIGFDKDKLVYIVSFKDNKNILNVIEISKQVYQEFDKFELEDLSILNEYDNHIEHSEMYESTLNKRSINKAISLEEMVERKLVLNELQKNLSELPDIQQRRIKKYYFENKTFQEIAKEENCTKRAVKFSVDIAVEKMRKNLKK